MMINISGSPSSCKTMKKNINNINFQRILILIYHNIKEKVAAILYFWSAGNSKVLIFPDHLKMIIGIIDL